LSAHYSLSTYVAVTIFGFIHIIRI
jgi:hypothetical protein